MRPTEQLIEEHNSIKLMLKIIKRVCDKLEAGEEVTPEHLDQIIEFIKGFADKCHHGKEEDLLFVALEETGFPRTGGPIGVMLAEHDIGRNYVKQLNLAVTEYKNGDTGVIPAIVENAGNYVTLLYQHIDKEDNILYPLADQHLSQAKQEELSREFEIVDREKTGLAEIDRFHKILNTLKEYYLEG